MLRRGVWRVEGQVSFLSEVWISQFGAECARSWYEVWLCLASFLICVDLSMSLCSVRNHYSDVIVWSAEGRDALRVLTVFDSLRCTYGCVCVCVWAHVFGMAKLFLWGLIVQCSCEDTLGCYDRQRTGLWLKMRVSSGKFWILGCPS